MKPSIGAYISPKSLPQSSAYDENEAAPDITAGRLQIMLITILFFDL